MTHPRDPTLQSPDVGLGVINKGEPAQRRPGVRWKPVPMFVLAAVVAYSLTIVTASVTFIVVNLDNNDLGRVCVQAGGSWVINDQGNRECTRGSNHG